MSIEIHIPYGGIQKRKTETVHKTELQDRGEGQQGGKKKQRGVEDGLICKEKIEVDNVKYSIFIDLITLDKSNGFFKINKS